MMLEDIQVDSAMQRSASQIQSFLAENGPLAYDLGLLDRCRHATPRLCLPCEPATKALHCPSPEANHCPVMDYHER